MGYDVKMILKDFLKLVSDNQPICLSWQDKVFTCSKNDIISNCLWLDKQVSYVGVRWYTNENGTDDADLHIEVK